MRFSGPYAAGSELAGSSAVTEDERTQYGQEFIAACRAKGLDAVAITDHHDLCMFKYIRKAAAAKIMSPRCSAFGASGLTNSRIAAPTRSTAASSSSKFRLRLAAASCVFRFENCRTHPLGDVALLHSAVLLRTNVSAVNRFLLTSHRSIFCY